MNSRIIVWFSCGAASAVAAKTAIALFKPHPVEIIYCDSSRYEHPDNIRFFYDVEQWIGQKIIILKSKIYTDIMDVFRKKRFIVGPHGAPCTDLLKKKVRIDYATPHDRHIFGMTSDEKWRISKYEKFNPQVWCEWTLRDLNITKKDCYAILRGAGIEIPAMYKLGYKNNNCIGCVKGGAGYWCKIREDFPDRFREMADLEKEIGGKILKVRKERIWLHDLEPGTGDYPDEDIECGTLCVPTMTF